MYSDTFSSTVLTAIQLIPCSTWSQAAHRHQSSELKAVMTALKSRDGQLATAQRQLQGLQEADANDKQSLADIIAGLRGTFCFEMQQLQARCTAMSQMQAAYVD